MSLRELVNKIQRETALNLLLSYNNFRILLLLKSLSNILVDIQLQYKSTYKFGAKTFLAFSKSTPFLWA